MCCGAKTTNNIYIILTDLNPLRSAIGFVSIREWKLSLSQCVVATSYVLKNFRIFLPAMSTSQKHQPSEKNSIAPSSLTTSGVCGSEAQYPPAAVQRVTPNDAIAYAPYRGTTTRSRFINSHRANAVLEY